VGRALVGGRLMDLRMKSVLGENATLGLRSSVDGNRGSFQAGSESPRAEFPITTRKGAFERT